MLEEFKRNLTVDNESTLYNKYLLGNEVWLFEKEMKKSHKFYDELKGFMAQSLNVPMPDIAVVGSSKLGFSLNPKKLFAPNTEASDIDLIVVSPALFQNSWDAFLELSKRGHISNYPRLTSTVFQRFISLKGANTDHDFFKEWTVKMDACKKDLQTRFQIYREINYRIYNSWGSVEAYHTQGLRKIRRIMETKQNE